ncbi:unnamed protein product [Paramecium pentaurelia]|uniref:EF-hand domain-containing protein n=1 Tax=Paramecium pentaurelia TaxID=43138 RepID=A0A8S1WRM4_9CILI|nr:unnamed protein product [Paramecium pentaurelia]
MQRQVYISPERMVVEKLEKYPALNSDPNYDHSRFQEIEAEFKTLDIDQSGWLSLAELELHLKRKGCDQNLIQEIFNELNTNQDQKISKDEFTHGYLNKESNLKEDIKQIEIKIKLLRTQEEDIKSKLTQTNCSQLIITLQSGCLSQFYRSEDDVIKAYKQIEVIFHCNEAQDGIERISKPSLNCEFPVWGDKFNYSLNQVSEITISIELIEIDKLDKQSLGKIILKKILNSEFDKQEKIIFENVGEVILQIQFIKDWNEQVSFQVSFYENCINQYLEEIKQIKKKLFFMKQLYTNSSSIHYKSLKIKESQPQSVRLSQIQETSQKNTNSQFPQIPIYLTHQMVQEVQVTNSIKPQNQLSNSKIFQENQLINSGQSKQLYNPSIQQQIITQIDQNIKPNQNQLKQAESIQMDYTIQNNIIDAFNLFNHDQTESDDLCLNLEQFPNDDKYKMIYVLIGLITLNIAYSRCDFLGLILLLLTIPYQQKKWNPQQINFYTIGMIISAIMDIYWLYKFFNCFSESYQCNNQYGFVLAIYLFCFLALLGKLYTTYKIRSYQ